MMLIGKFFKKKSVLKTMYTLIKIDVFVLKRQTIYFKKVHKQVSREGIDLWIFLNILKKYKFGLE